MQQLVAFIVDDRGELEEEVQALRSLAILAYLQVRKANKEKEEMKEVLTKLNLGRLKKKKIGRLHLEKAILQADLVKSWEEASQYCLEWVLFEEERDNLRDQSDELWKSYRELQVENAWLAKQHDFDVVAQLASQVLHRSH